MNISLDWYFVKHTPWQAEIEALRAIVLEPKSKTPALKEELKWGCPCYTHKDRNIVLIHVFKNYCALLFFKGALLKDEAGVLIQQTANVQAARQLRFGSLQDVLKRKRMIRTWIQEAIQLEEAGTKVPLKKTAQFEMVEEFRIQLDKSRSLKKAFESLTPGRQRAYLLHFSGAKQATTREARVQKFIPKILKGKGIDD